jgi:thioredoxin 1
MTFESYINGTTPVVVDFFATWCGPCMHMMPVLQQLKRKVGDKARILKMDIDKNPAYTERYEIRSVPTLIIFARGRVIWRKSGIPTLHELLAHLHIDDPT